MSNQKNKSFPPALLLNPGRFAPDYIGYCGYVTVSNENTLSLLINGPRGIKVFMLPWSAVLTLKLPEHEIQPIDRIPYLG